uniref:DOT1 domain-containing protein n=1 Tax=Panagrellus redivivus TaxID=6233 RepID=A0A7E4VS33_PANRE
MIGNPGKCCCYRRMGTEMTLLQAQEEFATILARLSPSKVPSFVGWIGDGFGSLEGGNPNDDAAEQKLKAIRRELRAMLPIDACFKSKKRPSMIPSSSATTPSSFPKSTSLLNGHAITHLNGTNGTNGTGRPSLTPSDRKSTPCRLSVTSASPSVISNGDSEQVQIEVDDFLYDDFEVDKLIADEQIPKYYCGSCGSRDVQSVVFVSHSTNMTQLRYIFTYLLPKLGLRLDDKVFVDIGSRLGGVIYAASLYCPNIGDAIGIEPNGKLCDVQTKIVDDHKLWDKVNIVHDKFQNQKKVLAKANFVFMNDVFRTLVTPEEKAAGWHKLRALLKPQTVLIHIPSLRKVTKNVDLGFEIEEWLEQLDTRRIPREYARDFHHPSDLIGQIEVFRVR